LLFFRPRQPPAARTVAAQSLYVGWLAAGYEAVLLSPDCRTRLTERFQIGTYSYIWNDRRGQDRASI